ncbi:MAG: hypothetical protein MMC23_001588 [Stictis urceolatum]|nr:hypothetical protein [Stictis urceolata]
MVVDSDSQNASRPTASTTATSPAQTALDQPITVLASSRAVLRGRLTEATIVISQNTGKITSIYHSVLPASSFPTRTPYTDYSPNMLMPGLVDAHVHLNEPGRTEWEGFWTGTQAAAFGGVTTVIDMPLNAIPPTTTVAAFGEKLRAAENQCWVDVGFYGGLIPGNTHELVPLVKRGVRGFKGFLTDSGVPEFPAVSAEDISLAMAALKDAPTTLMFHAEMIPPFADSVDDDVQISLPPLQPHGPLTSYSTFLASRPPSFETYAIAEILSLAHLAPELPLHIVHLSALEAIPLLREARAAGVKITAETCFHYLALAAESIPDGDTRHKCCPPIRGKNNQDRLWEELMLNPKEDSVLQTVVSDHSPCTPELKLLPTSIPGACGATAEAKQGKVGDFFSAWGGVSSVGLGLPILWTHGQERGISIEDIVRWCCKNTAKQVGLEHCKGDLRVGMDADVCVFDDAREWVLEGEGLKWKNRCSAYEGKRFCGKVVETWVRGRRVWGEAMGWAKEGPTGRRIVEERRA